MSYIPHRFVTHREKVQRLYKRVLRDIQHKHYHLHEGRVNAIIMRDRFEKNRHIKDPILAKQVLEEGEYEYECHRMIEPFAWPDSPLGTAYQRQGRPVMDWIYDYYHPLEKAQYPKYFATREKRKKEFIEWYNRLYGKPTELEDTHDH